ncbi:CarboxypepD_reg-like domain-containing protein [Salegentibacter echinorum]|uniref:CarboxypepD_reg-like domain-containing protein n=1 Tax=Salegentibacter echinorum TaxID=1073325 RepID=A0A1M5LZX6_SALEC|nr:carboxypeptidase-like regulatory domain-containing protein [Salegentibacter echinorum]SHG70239.1 CarboxypepD_reg-like domain-containing protein [Salegentibacter echinorum]
MQAKVIFILFCLAVVTSYAQSREISGEIVDEKTGKSLAFASVLVAKTEQGTSADENGVFSLKLKDTAKTLKLIVSNIGYESKEVPILNKEHLCISLNRLIEELETVNLIRPKNTKRHRVNSFRLGKQIGIGNFSGGKYPSTVARYYQKPEDFEAHCFINEIKIKFFSIPERQYKTAKFRLRIMAVDSAGKPGKDILFKDLILEKPKTRNSLKVDMSQFYIEVPQQGFFVALEHLFIQENAYKEVHNYRVNDTIYKNVATTKYAPVFKGILEENDEDFNSYYLSVAGWRKMNKLNVAQKFDGEIPAPAFVIKFTD